MTDIDDYHQTRIDALKRGRDQWGHAGRHHGRHGDPECPPWLHHHHDDFCTLPTPSECAAAGVEYRTEWVSRA